MLRYLPLLASLVSALYLGFFLGSGNEWIIFFFLLASALSVIGIIDLIQSQHSLRRNYPILAHIRFLLEEIRPEIRQYFLESDTDGLPFNRSKRAVVYQRAKHQLETRPFGTLQNVYDAEFEWLSHSIVPKKPKGHDFRTVVGGPQCAQPYSLSLLNISAMSFGALSANAIRALNKGAKMGGLPMIREKAASVPIIGNMAVIWSGKSAQAISAAVRRMDIFPRSFSRKMPLIHRSK